MLITAATSSFLMAAHHQHSDMTQQVAWAATQSYYAQFLVEIMGYGLMGRFTLKKV